jgi:tRNA (guanine37-N1)-methyltransferase
LGKKLRQRIGYVATEDGSARVYNSFDIVGDIAITKLLDASAENLNVVAKGIMGCNKGVKTVLAQASRVSGDYRLRKLNCIGGEEKTLTIHKEHGCTFLVDVEKCYFSPRLSGERLRIASLVKSKEIIVNMFSGVGCFSIIIARKVPSAKVYSIDINPAAVKFMEENIKANRVQERVIPLLGDSKEIMKTQLQQVADRILMPLPEKAFEYLPIAVSALKHSSGWIHLHAFEHADKTEDPVEKVKQKVAGALDSLGVVFRIPHSHIVRSTGPNWYQVVADIYVE